MPVSLPPAASCYVTQNSRFYAHILTYFNSASLTLICLAKLLKDCLPLLLFLFKCEGKVLDIGNFEREKIKNYRSIGGLREWNDKKKGRRGGEITIFGSNVCKCMISKLIREIREA